jgi:hypothetical protein
MGSNMNVKELIEDLKQKETNMLKTAKMLRTQVNGEKLIERLITVNTVPLTEGEKQDISKLELGYIKDLYALYLTYEKAYMDILTSTVTLEAVVNTEDTTLLG